MMEYIYMGEGRDDVPKDATHFRVHPSINAIPEAAFACHPNIVKFICHKGIKRIERCTFYACPSLQEAVMPGVEFVGYCAFEECPALEYVECENLERIETGVFLNCTSLRKMKLSAAKIVKLGAFDFSAITDVKFGKNLEAIGVGSFNTRGGPTFGQCASLQRITIPLRESILQSDSLFAGCENLNHVELVEREDLQKIIDALLLEKWRNTIVEEIDSINQDLSSVYAGVHSYEPSELVAGEKTLVIRAWIRRVRRKIIRYEEAHRRLLSEAATIVQLALPEDIVMNNLLPFLQLPCHIFEDENQEELEGDDDNANGGMIRRGRRRRRNEDGDEME